MPACPLSRARPAHGPSPLRSRTKESCLAPPAQPLASGLLSHPSIEALAADEPADYGTLPRGTLAYDLTDYGTLPSELRLPEAVDGDPPAPTPEAPRPQRASLTSARSPAGTLARIASRGLDSLRPTRLLPSGFNSPRGRSQSPRRSARGESVEGGQPEVGQPSASAKERPPSHELAAEQLAASPPPRPSSARPK